MTRGARRILWSLGILAALAVAVALAVPYLVDINRYHDLIQAQASQALNRRVSLGRMKLEILPRPGVSIEPVSIASDRKGDPPLLEAKSVAAHARLAPLLRGKIEVASLVAIRPQLYLHRHPDGHFNLPETETLSAAAGPASPTGAAAGEGLSLSRLRIRNAKLRLVDEAVIPGKRVTTVLDSVTIALDGYAPGRPFGIELNTNLPPRGTGSLSLAGILALPPGEPERSSGTSDMTLSLKKFQPSAFAPYLRAYGGIDPPAGTVSADLEAQARLRTAADGKWQLEKDGSLRGKIQLREVSLTPSAPGAKSVRTGDLDLSLDLSVGRGGRNVSFRKLDVQTGKTRLSAGGGLDFGETSTRIDLRVRPSRVMAEDIATVAAVLGAGFPAGLTSSAPISFSGSVTGPLDQPDRLRFRGEIALSGVRYADPTLGRPIEDVAGKLAFENDSLKVAGFSARVSDTKVAGSLEVRDFQSPRIQLALSSPKANLDELLALLTPKTPAAGAARPTSSAPASPNDILSRIRGAGTVRIDGGSFGTFRFSRFTGDLSLEGQVVTFDPVSFQLYGGTYKGALTADLRGAQPRYFYRSELAGVDAQKFLAENLGVPDLLGGAVFADLKLEGAGSDLDRILSTLKGRGTLRVEKGWAGQLNVLKGLAKASNLLGEKTLAQVSGDLAKSRTDFSTLTGDLEIGGGRVITNNLRAFTPNLELDGKGSFTLAGILDLDLKVLFSRELTAAMLAEGSRARYLEREGDRILLPLTIKGPLAAPTYGVDLRAITRAAARSELSERLSQSKSPLAGLLGERLGQKPGRPVAPVGEPAEPAAPSRDGGPASGSGIQIISRKYEGKLLLPDLTLRGEFTGTGLSRADLKVEGKRGRTVLEKEDAFREIAAYYATHRPGDPARIPFKLKIDGKRLAGAGDLTITITLHRSDGTTTVETFTQEKRGL